MRGLGVSIAAWHELQWSLRAIPQTGGIANVLKTIPAESGQWRSCAD